MRKAAGPQKHTKNAYTPMTDSKGVQRQGKKGIDGTVRYQDTDKKSNEKTAEKVTEANKV